MYMYYCIKMQYIVILPRKKACEWKRKDVHWLTPNVTHTNKSQIIATAKKDYFLLFFSGEVII